jgi:Fic-DOC domain mobile mystery protein B
MGLTLEYLPGQTPLDEDEKDGLLIPTITTRGELDEFEQKNIEEAMQWSLGRNFNPETIFREDFIKQLHQRMYGEVWAWAGYFRKTDKNMGVAKWQIPLALKSLLSDALFWVQNNTMPPEEIAIYFKHRLVSIHCFPNGNGRHSRLVADLIISKIYKQPEFTWGAAGLFKASEVRNQYLKALRAADRGDYSLLLAFANS